MIKAIANLAKRIRGYQGICGANPNTATLFLKQNHLSNIFWGVCVCVSKLTGPCTSLQYLVPARTRERCQVTRFLICDQMQIFLPEQTLDLCRFRRGNKKIAIGCRNSSTSKRSNDSMDFNDLLMEYQRPPQPSWVHS